jgi:pimeloyl-ACP methyl ester carboxylesterase
MKVFIILCVFIHLLGCGSDSSKNESTPFTSNSTASHTDFYLEANQPVSFTDVSALAYESPTEKLFYGDSALQYVEYWSPIGMESNNDLPALVFIHGGCWSNSYRIDQSYPIATALALNGFHVWSVEYRATGDRGGGWPGTYNDIERALTFISSIENDYYNDRKQVVIGHSAGGHLALLAASNLDRESKTIGLAAITQLDTYARESGGCNTLATSFMNGSPIDIPEEYALANPQLPNLANDAYLFAGEIDTIVDTSQASNSGLAYEIVQETGHFDWIHPGTKSFTVLLNYLLNI